MHISIDATGVSESGAGIVTYLLGLIRGWKDAGFDDTWTLQSTRDLAGGVAEEMEGLGTVHLAGSFAFWSRIGVQQTVLPVRMLRTRPDVLLCTTPVVPSLTVGVPVVAVVHDLRHLSHPEDFSRSMYWYRRRAWGSGIKRATRLITVSERTLDDLGLAYPADNSKARVVHLGSDHVDRIAPGEQGRHGIAFARWANKRPDFAIRSWAALKDLDPQLDRKLHVVGAGAEEREGLNELARQLGIGDLVVVHPFLGEKEFWQLFAPAAVVLFPSTFEGFGLPVLEAMRLKVPVVTWRDPAIVEVAGNCVSYAEPTPEDFAIHAQKVLGPSANSNVEAAFERTRAWTWRATADKTRAVLQEAVDAGARG